MKSSWISSLNLVVVLAFGFSEPAQVPAQKAAEKQPDDSRRLAELDEFIRHFGADWSNVAAFYDLPWSAARFNRLEQLGREWQERQAKVDFDGLNQQGRIDFILLRNELKSELDELALRRRRLSEMEELLPFRNPLQELERSRWQMKPLDAAASASAVAAWPEQIKQLRERVERGRKAPREERPKVAAAPAEAKEAPPDQKPIDVPPLLARRAAAAVEELRGTLKTMSEVRRFIGGSYSPLYQCGYSIGALRLRALHHELVGSGKLTPKQFNDAVLTYGPIPVELIRAWLLGLPLTRETQAGWRFSD